MDPKLLVKLKIFGTKMADPKFGGLKTGPKIRPKTWWTENGGPKMNRDFLLLFPQQGLPLGSLLALESWWPGGAPPSSAARVLRTGCQNRRFRRVPQGSLEISFKISL